MEDYFAAKARLFDGRSRRRGRSCVDDEWGRRMAARSPGRASRCSTGDGRRRRGGPRDITERRRRHAPVPRCIGPGVDLAAGCAVPGRYNVANALLALAMLARGRVPTEVAAPAVAAATVPGRMERIDAGPGLPRRRRLQPQAGRGRRRAARAAPADRAAG